MGRSAAVNREILRLALPSILANMTVPLVGMVDLGVAGHLDLSSQGAGTAALIGGIAIGTMLFDLLYWNFGFLRISTGGLTAQAWGAGDRKECAGILARSLSLALAASLFLILIQWFFVQLAFLVVRCTPEVETLARSYFRIRIWAAPATLSLMAFKGWFIGMQDGVSAMTTDLVVNGVNIVASVVLSLGIPPLGAAAPLWKGLGFEGIAWGTLAAQYAGLLCAVSLVLFKYRRIFTECFRDTSLATALRSGNNAKLFSMNADIFVRSLCFIAVYVGFTMISARLGDVLLAVTTIMMKLLMIFSYFSDGFAYAGEAMTGRYIGAGDGDGLRLSVRWNFVWCAGLSAVFMLAYGLGGVPMLRMMTSDPVVVDAARAYLPWLLLMPLAGIGAFAWDGIYVGATCTKYIRQCMVWAVAAFFAVWFSGAFFFYPDMPGSLPGATYEKAAHLLMAAYFAHLLARTAVLSAAARKAIFSRF